MTPRRFPRAIIAIAAVLAALAAASAADDDGRQLIQKVIDGVPKVSVDSTAILSPQGGIPRTFDLKRKPTKDGDASYLEVLSPENLKDTRFLFIERGPGGSLQYVYAPSFGRSMRVGGDAKKQSFLGSEFYVSDLIMPDLNAFTFTATGDEEVAGRKCKLVESVPKNPADEPYSKVVMAIDPADALIVRTQFFDPKGKLLKVWTVDKLEKVQGNWTPRLHTVTNVQENTSSKLEVTEVKYGGDIPDEVFTKPYLER
jgi:hypothetical protein